MRVFITGGSGFIGSAVIRELLAAGHQVTGLARTPEAEKKIADVGATARRGELTDLAGLRAAAGEAEAVIHCAFVHDFSNLHASGEIDLRASEAMIEALSGKPFVCTSGTALLPGGRQSTEKDLPDGKAGGHRAPTEKSVLAAGSRGVRSATLRLPPSVHGKGDHGFVPFLMDIARKTGVSAYLGTGENRWPAVHRDDAAVLYRLAVERLADGTVPAGSAIHGNAEEGIAFKEIAEAIAARLGLGPAQARPPEHFGWMATFVGIDNPTSSAWTREKTGWKPTRTGLLEDVRSDAYAG